jgi:ABC-type oligopeptide transport system substrate-binding subunit
MASKIFKLIYGNAERLLSFWYYLSLNLQNPQTAFFRDIRVRQALQDALDQKAITQSTKSKPCCHCKQNLQADLRERRTLTAKFSRQAPMDVRRKFSTVASSFSIAPSKAA